MRSYILCLQCESSLSLNWLIVSAFTTLGGKLFQSFTTRLAKKYFLTSRRHDCFCSLTLCPLVTELENLNILSAGILSNPLIILKVYIISPLFCLWNKEGNFNCLSLSLYDLSRNSGINLVARL